MTASPPTASTPIATPTKRRSRLAMPSTTRLSAAAGRAVRVNDQKMASTLNPSAGRTSHDKRRPHRSSPATSGRDQHRADPAVLDRVLRGCADPALAVTRDQFPCSVSGLLGFLHAEQQL